MSRGPLKKIDKVLEESIQQEKVLAGARAWRVLRRWNEVVGETLAAKSIPDRYEGGTVWIAVLGSAWSAELRMQKPAILSKLREISGEPNLFQNLRFGVRKVEKAVIVIPNEPKPLVAQTEKPTIREIGEKLIKKLQDEGRA